MLLSSAKRRFSTAVILGFALLSGSCLHGRPAPLGSSFYSNFSVRELVERNQSASGFKCVRPAGGGGGGSDFNVISSQRAGSSKAEFKIHKGDSFTCELKPGDNFDEQPFFDVLKLDTERALRANGAQISDSGPAKPAGFYFTYTASSVRGRIQVSGSRTGDRYYNVHAELDENGN
jgi:hypothetical protein